MGFLRGIGPITARILLQNDCTLEELFHADYRVLAKKTKLKPTFFREMQRDSALEMSLKVVDFHSVNAISSLYFQDQDFPYKLNQCLDAPLQLFYKGNIDLNQGKFVAIVGTRDATEYGKTICRKLVESFVGRDIVVVSGLAHGIDAWAHHYCVELGVPTIAVLGHGLDMIYPSKHRVLAKEIIGNGGLLTEFGPETIPNRENFPKRNRVVAGLCDATIVVESKPKGGSLITAELANDYSRDVFAFPGSIFCESSQGCNQLIASDAAHLLTTPDEFLYKMGWAKEKPIKNVQRKVFVNLSPVQKKIVDHLQIGHEMEIDRLSIVVGIPVSKLNAELLLLEMDGMVSVRPGNRFRINA